MNNNEYFVPDIEDFYVGYEFEFEGIPKGWHKMIFSIENTLKTMQYNIEKLNCIRVSYLTYKQIFEEGWEMVWNDANDGIAEFNLTREGWNLTFSIGWKESVNNVMLTRGTHIFFDGECKSINELRYVLKLLQIK